MKDKKTRIAIISVVALLLVLIGVTYAYWLVTKTQTNSNIISSACLDITLDNEANDISLSSQYPMSDEDGMKLTPYTFTVTNNCNTSIDYQVALEAIGAEATSIASSAIKVALDNNIKLYSNYGEVATTISGAYESHSIGYARLAASGNEGSSVTHSLRIWIDENAPISEANKTFQSRISITVGQGIDSPYDEGTLAYDILASAGGINAASSINLTKLEDRIVSYESSIRIYQSMKSYYGTSYTLNEETGIYTLSGDVIEATLIECRNGTKACGQYTTATYSKTTSSLKEITDFGTESHYAIGNIREYTNEFKLKVAEGMYKAQDDLGDSYYYRGNVTNNYVQFGTYAVDTIVGKETVHYQGYFYDYCGIVGEGEMCYTSEQFESQAACEASLNIFDAESYFDDVEYSDGKNHMISGCYLSEGEAEKDIVAKAGDPIYWRIVRINGDGTIRLVYDGIDKAENGVEHNATIGSSAYQKSDSDPKYIGYTYDSGDGTQTDSIIKGVVDTWYVNNLKNVYGTYIADGIFCNDREVISSTYEGGGEGESGEYIETYLYYQDYTANRRLFGNVYTPKLTCTRTEDRYTKSESLGNGLLTNPIGLLTADEVVFSQGYLSSTPAYWTMTPNYYLYSDGGGKIFIFNDTGNSYGTAGQSFAVRPVINLRADVEFTGDGSFENPYVIVTE